MIYLASPYSHSDILIMKTRFLLAEEITAQLIMAGKFVYSPIVHCHELAQKFELPKDFVYWRRYNIDMLRRADQMYILDIPGWDESQGVKFELQIAVEIGIEVFMVNQKGEVKPWFV